MSKMADVEPLNFPSNANQLEAMINVLERKEYCPVKKSWTNWK